MLFAELGPFGRDINVASQQDIKGFSFFGLKRDQLAKSFVCFASTGNIDGPFVGPAFFASFREMPARFEAKLLKQSDPCANQPFVCVAEADRSCEKSSSHTVAANVALAIKEAG
jgi:hypothetical protein